MHWKPQFSYYIWIGCWRFCVSLLSNLTMNEWRSAVSFRLRSEGFRFVCFFFYWKRVIFCVRLTLPWGDIMDGDIPEEISLHVKRQTLGKLYSKWHPCRWSEVESFRGGRSELQVWQFTSSFPPQFVCDDVKEIDRLVCSTGMMVLQVWHLW